MRKKRVVLWLGLGTAAAASAAWLVLPPRASDAHQAAMVEPAKANSREEASAGERWTALPAREQIGAPAGELFVTPSRSALALKSPPTPVKRAPPKMPYRLAGKLVQDDTAEVLLAKGNALVSAREGDKLDDGYRVEAIKRDHVVLLYLPLGVREKLLLGGTFIIDETYADAAADAAPSAQTAPPVAFSSAIAH